MGLTPQVLCCWTVSEVNRQNLYDQEATSFLFNCPHKITKDRIMEKNLRHIISLYVWLDTYFYLLYKKVMDSAITFILGQRNKYSIC